MLWKSFRKWLVKSFCAPNKATEKPTLYYLPYSAQTCFHMDSVHSHLVKVLGQKVLCSYPDRRGEHLSLKLISTTSITYKPLWPVLEASWTLSDSTPWIWSPRITLSYFRESLAVSKAAWSIRQCQRCCWQNELHSLEGGTWLDESPALAYLQRQVQRHHGEGSRWWLWHSRDEGKGRLMYQESYPPAGLVRCALLLTAVQICPAPGIHSPQSPWKS